MANTVTMPAKPPKVKANPVAELPRFNHKYLGETVELHMAGRGIHKIRSFEKFPCLEVLWLQDNEITTLNHLDDNFRLKNLYMSGNKLTTLEGSSLRFLPNLELLHLADNQITDLSIQLRELQAMPFLKQLELLGNPVAEETNYRAQVLFHMPSIKVLDRHVVTAIERVLAQNLAKEHGWKIETDSEAPSAEQQMHQVSQECQVVPVTKRGVHVVSGPRIWRKRVCFGIMYQPPHIKPVKFRPGLDSQGEKQLRSIAECALRDRKRANDRLLKEMYAGLGPPKVGNYESDAVSTVKTTPQIEAFRDELRLSRMIMKHSATPPKARTSFNPTQTFPAPATARTARIPPTQMLTSRKPMTPTSTSTVPTIELDNNAFATFQRTRRNNQIQRFSATQSMICI